MPSAWTWTIPTTSTRGLQDHDSWKGPSNSKTGNITLADWTTVGTGDGMYNQVDPTDSRWVYNTFQTGGQRRFDQETGQATTIEPRRQPGAAGAALQLDHADRAVAAQSADCLHRRAGPVSVAQPRDDWQEISPDLTTNDSTKCGLNSGLRAVLHDHVDLGIAGDAGRHLDRHRRRQGSAHAGPRRDLDGPDGRGCGGRRTSGPLCQPRVRVIA